jgi:hypothetical protein
LCPVHVKKHLGFSSLIKTISKRLLQIEDFRKGEVDYTLHDCFMSAFAMMFFQDPSLLQFQRRMQKSINRNNLKTVFNVSAIPKDTQLRDNLDESSTAELEKIFSDFFAHLQRGKHLETYQFIDGYYLMPTDGSEYFSSKKICCPGCLVKKSKDGTVRYHHQILQSVIVHPDKKQVIPLAPEPIQNTDGSKKQDCEINAAKRLLKKIRKTHPKLKIIFVGDGLYSKQPFIDELKKANIPFILVAKPSDHKILYEWFTELKNMGETKYIEYKDFKGRRHCYEWLNDIPLNGTKNADNINYFEYNLIVEGKVTYHNSWVTDFPVTKDNVVGLVKGGRARWKIENEGFNTLKNQGYHIEHNFGHGKKNLSMIFFLLNLLAFFTHQILELTDLLYQQCRDSFSSRKEFWNQLRCTFRIIVFKNLEHMLSYIYDTPDARAP